MGKRLIKLIACLRRNIFYVLNLVQYLLILLLAVMLINLNVSSANQSKNTQQISENTQRIVASQDAILKAIKNLAEDANTTAEHKTNTIICMLQVPVEQRTTDVLNNCRTKAINGQVTAPTPKASAP